MKTARVAINESIGESGGAGSQYRFIPPNNLS